LTRAARFVKGAYIQRVMIFSVRLRFTGDHTSWKDKAWIIGEACAREANQRVFTATRWADDKHKRAFFHS
jgi:hypothetical protein